MANNCLPLQPINPINQILLDVFGPNYFPSFDSSQQPGDRATRAQEPLLEMQLPGGGVIAPTGDPLHKQISEIVAPMIGQLAPIFAFFGPLFIVLDVIRAIIDIICALLNPIPLVKSVVELFAIALPPIIALFPPFASILLVLNAVKLVVSIIVSMTAVIVPIIDQIVSTTLEIGALVSAGDIKALDAITIKICLLLQQFTDQIGGLVPISFILEIIDFFMSLGGKFFCSPGSDCCDDASCPSAISSPAIGTATVTANSPQVSLSSILGGLVPIDPSADFIFSQPSMTLSDPRTTGLEDLKPFAVRTSKDKAAITVKVYKSSGLPASAVTLDLTDASANNLHIRGSDFPVGTVVNYEVIPDTNNLLDLKLISIGCAPEVKAAQAALQNQANEGSGNQEGNPSAGFDPLITKTGEPFPPLPTAELNAIFAAQQANPSVSQAANVFAVASNYIDHLTDFFETVVCIGASRTKSVFEVSKTLILADGKDHATITMRINDMNGANLLKGALPNAQFDAIFEATGATVGPVLFDKTNGIFTASLTSTTEGTATIAGKFLVRGKICCQPGVLDGIEIKDKILDVAVVPPSGQFQRRRQQTEYIQSSGGRRR